MGSDRMNCFPTKLAGGNVIGKGAAEQDGQVYEGRIARVFCADFASVLAECLRYCSRLTKWVSF